MGSATSSLQQIRSYVKRLPLLGSILSPILEIAASIASMSTNQKLVTSKMDNLGNRIVQLLQSVDESRERDDPMANRLGPALVSALAKLEDLERLGSVSRMLDASTIIETLNEIRHEIDSAVGDETLFAVKAMQHTISKFFHSQEIPQKQNFSQPSGVKQPLVLPTTNDDYYAYQPQPHCCGTTKCCKAVCLAITIWAVIVAIIIIAVVASRR